MLFWPSERGSPCVVWNWSPVPVVADPSHNEAWLYHSVQLAEQLYQQRLQRAQLDYHCRREDAILNAEIVIQHAYEEHAKWVEAYSEQHPVQ